jgi:hypothetical protein
MKAGLHEDERSSGFGRNHLAGIMLKKPLLRIIADADIVLLILKAEQYVGKDVSHCEPPSK